MVFSTVVPQRKPGPQLLRMGHLLAFTTFLRHHGVPVGRYLRRHGLPTLCDDPDTFVPFLRMLSFFDDVTRHEDLELGWQVGGHVGDHNLNADLLRKLENAPTLYQALLGFVQMISAESSDIDIDILERRDDILLYTHDPAVAELPGYMVSETYQIQVFLDLIRHFLGQHWIPDEIGFEFTRIPSIIKEQLPGCRIRTQQIASYVAVPRFCLHQAVPPWDAKIGNLENPLSEKLPALTKNFDYMDTLRATIIPYLSEGYVSQRIAAELMDTSLRTLTRKLNAYGLTYGELIDEVRFDEARKQLQIPSMQIGEVAHCVGFNDQGDFSRMIRRVGGLSPTQLRDSLGGKGETAQQHYPH